MEMDQAFQSLVRAELERICNSPVFSPKKQAQNFLRYIVEETLMGRANKITQYALALDALGKPETFDPTDDPSVRMQATRIRKLLVEFYDQDQASEPEVRIDLPIGSYHPMFLENNNTCDVLERTQVIGSMSMGPKILVLTSADNKQDNKLRHFLHELYSSVTVVLSRFREARIVLADPTYVHKDHASSRVYAWEKHQAEFILELDARRENQQYLIQCRLFHALNQCDLETLAMRIPSDNPDFTDFHLKLVENTISLHRGVVLRCWSQFWHTQKRIPDHYQVLVRHIHFLQLDSSPESFQQFLSACTSRIERFDDDALAYLHYAILCMYAHMTDQTLAEPLVDIWYKMAQKSLELNPWNALAHGIYALACAFRGDTELCNIEIEVARYANPLDLSCLHMIAAGLCAIGKWERGFDLLKTLSRFETGRPPLPQQTLLCTHFFRRGQYAELSRTEEGFRHLGGWEHFNTILNGCQRHTHCKNCIEAFNHVLDHFPGRSDPDDKDLPVATSGH